MTNQKNKYLHWQKKNNQGYEMEIIDYNTYADIIVEFKEPYHCIVKTSVKHFKEGCIHNPYAPLVLNIGITGNKYSTRNKIYTTWLNMLKRCFSNSKDHDLAYKDVSVCNEWFYYENFYEWYINQSNYKILESINDINIDKDILCKGNKIYTPDKCTLVPKKVNDLFVRYNINHRGSLPMGVHKEHKKYLAELSKQRLGIFDTPEEAFNAYKDAKEKKIQSIAQEEYDKGTITQQCYEAMMNYKVEITD